jgi:uncharacterized protein YjiS (DUF1127 family)
MFMSVSSTVERRDEAGRSVPTRLATAVRRLCVALIGRRVEQSAIVLLRAMDDRALNEIGLSRAQITSAVRARPHAAEPREGDRDARALRCAGTLFSLHACVHRY